MKRFLIISFMATFVSGPSPAASKPVLTVYTYDSFQSQWGPGPKLKAEFLKTCQCDLKFVTSGDAGALLGRLKLERAKTKADIVLGLDSTVTAEAKALGIFAPVPTGTKWSLPVTVEDLDLFQPIDFGWYAFMVDTSKTERDPKRKIILPTSLEALLKDPTWNQKILIQDPRSSSVGLGLLLWMHARFGENTFARLKNLKSQVMAVGQGWSDSYSKFTNGEAPFVFSYTTSEAYHLEQDKTERYQALAFDDGHYVQVEVAGRIKHSTHAKLADDFLRFLATPVAQKLIAHGNWMYPVIESVSGLPPAYSKVIQVKKTLYLPASVVQANRKVWTDEWMKVFSEK